MIQYTSFVIEEEVVIPCIKVRDVISRGQQCVDCGQLVGVSDNPAPSVSVPFCTKTEISVRLESGSWACFVI